VRLLGAAEALRERSGAPIAAADRSRYTELIERLLRAVRPDTFAGAWREGRELSLDAAIDLALRDEAPVPRDVLKAARDGAVEKLSRRENEVAQLIARGQSNREIAEMLVISVNTVETHVKHLFKKLGMGSRSEIAAWAARQDLV